MCHLTTLTRRLQLCPFSFGNINNGRQHKQSFRSLNWVETDFYRDLSAVFAQSKELPLSAHSPSPCVVEITMPIADVIRPESLGNKHLDGMVNQLLTGVTEDSLRLRVNQGNATFCVHHYHGTGRSLNNQTELFFGLLALGNVKRSATHANGLTITIKLDLTPARNPP